MEPNGEVPVSAVIFADGSVRIMPNATTLAIFKGAERLQQMINAPIRFVEAEEEAGQEAEPKE